MSKDLECPYCGAWLDICHDDGFGYDENVNHQMECNKCDKSFIFQTSISFHYEPYQADCLNDGNHDFRRTQTFPYEFAKMRCDMCGEEREMTLEERKSFGLQTKEEYFEKLRAKSNE